MKITLDTSFLVAKVLVREQWEMKLLSIALKESALVVKTDLILASVTTKKHEATTTTTMEQELSVSKLLQGSRVNRSPLSFVANLPYTSKNSAAFQGCSSHYAL